MQTPEEIASGCIVVIGNIVKEVDEGETRAAIAAAIRAERELVKVLWKNDTAHYQTVEYQMTLDNAGYAFVMPGQSLAIVDNP